MPTLFDICFYLFAATIVVSAIFVCFSRNIVHAAFSLLFTFFGVAGVYVLLSADFIAVSQILLYVGGILVLIVFGVMLTNRVTNIDIRAAIRSRIPAAILCGALLFIIVSLLVGAHWITFKEPPWGASPWNHDAVEQAINPTHSISDQTTSHGTAMELGKLMMTDYVLPFEVVSIVLLVALLGAAMIARRDGLSNE